MSAAQPIKNYLDYIFALLISLKPQIIFIIVVFCAGIMIGWSDLLNINQYMGDDVWKLLSTFRQYQGVTLFAMIFFNNARAMAIMLFSGILLGIFPIIGGLVNGMMIGFVLQTLVILDKEITIGAFIIQLAPHGIFEIPALFIALALGVKSGGWVFSTNKTAQFKINLKEAATGYLKVIIPLLVIAACIETIGIEAK